jgi:pyruvate-formate lyase
MMTSTQDRILWCYGEYQTLYGIVDGVDFQQGLPDLDTLDPRDKHLIILDDLMDEADQRVASLFTKKSHHRNISFMYIVQNLFHRGKHHRTISLNAHYMALFKIPRDVSQIMALGCPSLAILVESLPHLLFRIKSGILHYTTRCDPVLGSSCV